MMPLGGLLERPPGRTMVNSRSLPGPEKKSSSWLFLSAKIFFITVHMRTLKKKGAWFSESPAPMDVTTEMRFTPFFMHSLMMLVVPSVSIVSPTSEDLPPSATTTPVTSPDSKTLATSAAEVTVPSNTVSASFTSGVPAAAPPEPGGTVRRDLSLTRARTTSPLPRAWNATSEPTPPVAPKTARLILTRARGDMADGAPA
mmetsp:Transcript_22854/g.69955  ORF Transcript_22854/g.69955 Transcript_22854/m.69955 type:complete len:200 (+) Transcript_22854:397-996(+)